ncbi:unnamed protein product [Hydatigera taeniaeformis]|uniref:LAM_G_DOMAIN domain-containing protein n=1 Tax=Hydatigena taeniaeformis TaxID=6205 RepID=A0A0R3WUY3_HYDTA|nr:unnamed protein product [Hydatigera taeniaeformis]
MRLMEDFSQSRSFNTTTDFNSITFDIVLDGQRGYFIVASKETRLRDSLQARFLCTASFSSLSSHTLRPPPLSPHLPPSTPPLYSTLLLPSSPPSPPPLSLMRPARKENYPFHLPYPPLASPRLTPPYITSPNSLHQLPLRGPYRCRFKALH